MNFKFNNLLGAPYRGGNVLLSGNTLLLSPVGNRISITDLVKSETVTLPCENSKSVCKIAVSPNGALLLSVDEDGKCLLINLRRRIVLHHLSFKGPVSALKFSPNGTLFAVGVGKLCQVWRTPGFKKEFAPFQLVRTFARCHDSVTSIDWSPDGRWILAGSKDLTVRLFTLHKLENYNPVILMGHRDVITGVYFTTESNSSQTGNVVGAYTLSRDGALFSWRFHPPEISEGISGLSSDMADDDLTLERPSKDTTEVKFAPGSIQAGILKRTAEDDDEEDDFVVILNPHSSTKSSLIATSTPQSVTAEASSSKKRKNRHKGVGKGGQQVADESKQGSYSVEDGRRRIGDRNEGTIGFDSVDIHTDSVDVKRQEGFLAETVEKKSSSVLRLDKGRWELVKKSFFMQNAKLTACDYLPSLDLVVAGFASGIFGLYQMPDFTCIHLLSISKEKISTAVFNGIGNWLAFGCAKLGQLLVWEWRSESYVLKQQGHYFDVNSVAYSPDSQLIATGADDNKLKVWNASSGFCFVTFAEHSNAVTAALFLPGNNAVLSASLDGTVRAWDLLRYRNFRTFTTPSPTQFVSLASDQSGEVICAGSLDSFQIYVWSMKTGRLLDVLSGHEGPVHGLAFSPMHEMLASSSWDKTVRLWDVFEGKGSVETFTHTHDVLAVAYRPDGKQLACTTLDGQIHFWDAIDGQLMGAIEGRRDIAGGRLVGDRRTAANSSSGKCFATICYSADGNWLLAGGSSKYICMYDVVEQVLLRRFQISHNRSLDGVLDFLNSKRMTDAGPLDLIDDEVSDVEEGIDIQAKGQLGFGLPGAASNSGRPIVRTKCLQISPTGRSWVAATTEGVLVYSMDDNLVFDPTDLDIDITSETVTTALSSGKYTRALVLALRLNEPSLIRKCVESVPPVDVITVVSGVPLSYLGRLLEGLAEYLENSPHLEFMLCWCQEVCRTHGWAIQLHNKNLLPQLRSLQKAIASLHEDLARSCTANEYLLQYLCLAPTQAFLNA